VRAQRAIAASKREASHADASDRASNSRKPVRLRCREYVICRGASL
jgi:hypothetical protein